MCGGVWLCVLPKGGLAPGEPSEPSEQGLTVLSVRLALQFLIEMGISKVRIILVNIIHNPRILNNSKTK